MMHPLVPGALTVTSAFLPPPSSSAQQPASSTVFFPAYLVWKLVGMTQGRLHQWVRTVREERASQRA